MTNRKCCVVSDSLRQSNHRLNKAFTDNPQTQCQFYGAATNTFEYAGNFYCILHLPCEAEEKSKLSPQIPQIIQTFIKNNEVNFNFICVDKIKLTKIISDLEYSFVGIHVNELTFHECHSKALKLEFSKITNNLIMHSCTFEKLCLTSCHINSKISITEPNIKFLLALGNTFHSRKNISYDDVENLFWVTNGEIKIARFVSNNFNTILKITKTSFTQLRFVKNKFSSCPIFFKDDFRLTSEIDLPDKNEYLFTVTKNNHAKKKIWHVEYTRFREIYNIAKMREMYLEQSTYFSLMQKCQRNTSSTSCLLKFFNLCYWIISDYGQSVTRPIIGLILIFLISTCIFFSLGVEKINAPYLSLTQILKPYSLLYDREPRVLLNKLCSDNLDVNMSASENIALINPISQPECKSSLAQYKYGWFFIITSLLESTLSLVFLACLVLSLRWNFRKA